MSYPSDSQKSNIETDENDFDVVIVGAGMSGLAAANRLLLAGLNTLLIEKKNFSGGRLLSIENSKSYHAHESQYHTSKMISQLKLIKKSEKFPESHQTVHCRLNSLEKDVPFYVIGEIYHFVKIVDEVSKNNTLNSMKENINFTNLSSLSVEDMLCNLVFFTKSRTLCRLMIYVTCGTHQLETISALWYLHMLSGAGGFLQRLRVNLGDSDRYYVKGGAMLIAQLLTNKFESENRIHYDEEVRKIQFSDDRAHVWSGTRHYKCDYVIFTVPFTNNCQVIIEPDLHLDTKEIQIESRNVFFNALCEPSAEYHNIVKNILIRGEADESLTLIYDATCLENKKLHFSGFSSELNISPSKLGEIINKYCACTVMEFNHFTVSNGSFMNVFKPKDWKNIGWSLQNHGRIIFAGSEYATQWPGTIDGAIESGEFAAFSILQWMRPQSMDGFEWILSKKNSNFTKKSGNESTILHIICFWVNVFVAVSFLRTTLVSMMNKD